MTKCNIDAIRTQVNVGEMSSGKIAGSANDLWLFLVQSWSFISWENTSVCGCGTLSKPWNSNRNIQRTYHEVRSAKCDSGKLEFSGLLSSTYLICLRIRRSYGRTGTAESGEEGRAGFLLLHILVFIPRLWMWDMFLKLNPPVFTTDLNSPSLARVDWAERFVPQWTI